jgi:hypothetical protein
MDGAGLTYQIIALLRVFGRAIEDIRDVDYIRAHLGMTEQRCE